MFGTKNLKEIIHLFAEQIKTLQLAMEGKASMEDLKKEADRFPIGSPIAWPSATLPDTGNYAFMFGNAFDAAANPKNAIIYPTLVWPDMRGIIIKGNQDGRILLSLELDGNKSHTHAGSAGGVEGGSSETSSFDYGTKVTQEAGNHSHGINGAYTAIDKSGGSWVDGHYANRVFHNTNAAGNHTHNVFIGSHSHTVTVGAHTHTLTIVESGNEEVTVKNISFNYIVRKG